MGVLIPMPRSRPGSARPRVAEGSGSGGAEIVFFTGVRYERHEDKPAIGKKNDGPTRSRSRRRRA